MSVTLHANTTRPVQVDCPLCDGREDRKGECNFCLGTGTETINEPEVSMNLSNSNWVWFLGVSGLGHVFSCAEQDQMYGEIGRLRIMDALDASKGARNYHVAFVNWRGRTPDQFDRYLDAAEKVFTHAVECGVTVCWG